MAGMKAQAVTAKVVGVEGRLCTVEVEVQQGLPGLFMVGGEVPGRADARARVFSAIPAAGFQVPGGRVRLSLGGAQPEARLEPWQDLAIAVALLRASGTVPMETSGALLFLGELTLAGGLRPTRAVLPMVEAAAAAGFSGVVVPEGNAAEAALVAGMKVFALGHLEEVVRFLQGKLTVEPLEASKLPPEDFRVDMAEVAGQETGKAAMELAAAGGHGVLLVGAPGCGKTMLARRLATIMPPLSHEEALEATRTYSVAGLVEQQGVGQRPFRAPHHTISDCGLVGGGVVARPGEVSLAHTGVLFLDELTEFRKPALEALEQPLREGHISLARKGEDMRYHGKAQVVAAMSPCPCGGRVRAGLDCVCSKAQVESHWARAASFIQRHVDIQVEMVASATGQGAALPSSHYRARVVAACQRQQKRFEGSGLSCNEELTAANIAKFFLRTMEAQRLLVSRCGGGTVVYSAESLARLKALAMTCADLENREVVAVDDMRKALTFWNPWAHHGAREP